ncbi:MAG: spore coat protein CotJB [Clostridia bacterium]|nr:spore coat protein CotJB [Clostridia bacterium]MBQ7289257.1 spore coat protein CotJB [Clostridia bacterium]
MKDRKTLLRELSAVQFAAWELQIYLDTHPQDRQALQAMQKYQRETEKLAREFEERFGPITASDTLDDMSFTWINNPWPWEKEAN